MSKPSPKPGVNLKDLAFPQLKDALKTSTIPATKVALLALNVPKLKEHLVAQDVPFATAALKDVLIDLLTEKIHSAAGDNESKDNTKKPKVAGSNGDNAEKPNDAASNGRTGTGTQQRPVRTLNGSNDAPAAVTEIVTQTVTETVTQPAAETTAETEGSNANDEYERVVAEYDKLHVNDSFENELEIKTKKALDDAKQKFVEQFNAKASDDDLSDTRNETKRLEALLKPKRHDDRGFPILTSLNDSTGLQYRVEWKDEHLNKAIICCGPPVAAIWRVVPTSEAKAYQNYTEAPEWKAGRYTSDDTTTSAEARQVIGVAFKYSIVVGASIDKVFEKRSPKSRQDKIKSLPVNTTAEVKAMVARPRRRHIHVIMSYSRNGERIYKHAPITHWYALAGKEETKGLQLVLNKAKVEQERWEALLQRNHNDIYKQLEKEGLELELQEFQDSRDSSPPLEDSRDNTPDRNTEANNSKTNTSNTNTSNTNNSNTNNSQDGRDSSPPLENSRDNTPDTDTEANNSKTNISNTNNSNTNDSNTDDSNTDNSNANNPKNPLSAADPVPSVEI